MFPIFQGDAEGVDTERRAAMFAGEGHEASSGPFHRMAAEEEERQLGGSITDWNAADDGQQMRAASTSGVAATAPVPSPFGAPSGASVAQGAAGSYLASILSLAADAKLGAQVARVRLGLDAKVRQAFGSQLFFGSAPAGSLGSAGPQSTGSGLPAPDEQREMQALIERSRDAQAHLQLILGALEDYQCHRKGLADAAHRLGLALQEAGQRSPGPYGQALMSCGTAHQQAAACRMEAHAAEELHVLSKLRAHHGKAAADCRRAVRKFEAATQELRVLQHARMEAQTSKEMASGDSPLAPTVESDAARLEEARAQRVRSAAETVRGKLTMFEAKHAADYAASVASHFSSVAAEEGRISAAFAELGGSLEPVRKAAVAVELPST